ncbi:CDP-glycerol glycerophosphotransferase family protein [Isoptericola sp. F-RaC21]|uniref:CDP-glycerol glycerophosphotransferase family protein n=1 Tax=Isoptericola sp. F-RaC21 TaxID=3141452 RepID=UPI00315BF03F
MRLRVNVHGNLVLLLGAGVPPRAFGIESTRLDFTDGVLAFTGQLTAFDRQLAQVELRLVARQSETTVSCLLTVEPASQASEAAHGAVVHRISGSLDVRDLLETAAPTDTLLDPRIVVTDTEGKVQTSKVHERPATHGLLAPAPVRLGSTVAHVVPRFTFLGGNLYLGADRFTVAAHAALERVMRRPWWTTVARKTLGIWLVGEVPYKAQDNGYHFFRWVRRRHPLRLAYYVIAPDSPDRERVEHLGHVVERGSVKHVLLAACAARLVGSHHTEYLLPTADPRMLRAADGVRVMLQHGVLGTKNMVSTYGRGSRRTQPADVFHVSSPRERAIVVDDLGYAPSQVPVTGLPRFDRLLAPPECPPRGILVIPTWRSRIGTRQQFEASEFRARWEAFLNHRVIRELVARGEQVTFIMHPNMRKFTDGLEAPGVDVRHQGESAVQDLLREHAALVTDYSSVAFDFALQGRPVFYFQFDRAAYFGSATSHLDLDTDLPGPVLFDEEALAAAVEKSHDGGLVMEDEYRERALRVFPAHDRRSSQRAYRSVRRARRLADPRPSVEDGSGVRDDA